MQLVDFLILEMKTLEKISNFMNKRGFSREQGGLLLGYRKKQSIHITDCTFPGVIDGRARFKFVRRDPKHQRLALRAWEDSGKTCDWIGEWHSHPETHPLPSGIDKKTWQRQCSERRDAMCYIIIGMQENWFGLQTTAHGSVKRVSLCGCSQQRNLFS